MLRPPTNPSTSAGPGRVPYIAGAGLRLRAVEHRPHPGTPGSAKRTQLRGAALRDKIVESAAALFYEHGVHSISVDEIVRRTGMGKASVYRRFPTKNDLVLAVLQRHDDNFWTRWDSTAAEHTDPREELDAQLTWLQELTRPKRYRGCAVVNIAAEFGHTGSEQIRQRCVAHEHELARRFRALTARLGVADHDRLADQLHIAVVGAFAVAGIDPAGGSAGHLRALADSLIPSRIR